MPFNLLLLVWKDLVDFTSPKSPQPEIVLYMIIRASYDDAVDRDYIRKKMEKLCKDKFKTNETIIFNDHHLYCGKVAAVINEEEYLSWIKKND